MMKDLKKLFGGVNGIEPYDNPFNSDCIEKIAFYYRRKNIWGEEVNEFSATIEFKNGNTKGSHKIEAETFPDLYQKVLNFCESL